MRIREQIVAAVVFTVVITLHFQGCLFSGSSGETVQSTITGYAVYYDSIDSAKSDDSNVYYKDTLKAGLAKIFYKEKDLGKEVNIKDGRFKFDGLLADSTYKIVIYDQKESGYLGADTSITLKRREINRIIRVGRIPSDTLVVFPCDTCVSPVVIPPLQ
jgi:hypothetical protein